MSKRALLALLAATALIAGACSSRGTTDEAATTTTAGGGASADEANFGSLEAPCGPGEATVDAAENAGATDVIKVGTPTDKGFEIQPGLNVEMEDAAKSFIAWCNEQGGVQGLPLELVELDAGVFNVPAVMEQACEEVFALVGGGMVLDNGVFPRFHECNMIDIAGFTVSTEKAMSNGMAQPLPNPSNLKPTGWMEWAAANYPDEVQRTAVVYGDAGSIQTTARQDIEAMESLGDITIVDEISYSTLGEANWAPFAQRIKDNNVGFMTFVGQPANLVSLLRSMNEIGYRPPLIVQQTNFYDKVLTEGAGDLADGIFVRTSYAPFEEPDQFPAMAKYLANMAKYNPGGKIAGLGVQGTSAYLLFVVSANKCLNEGDGVLTRECVLAAARSFESWDGGGLHAPGNPAENLGANCELMLRIDGGAFVREYPEIGSSDDNGNGWHCYDPGRAELSGDYGDTEAGVDPSRPN